MSDRPMQPPPAGREPVGSTEDPWRLVSDAVLRGLNHELSNRAAALSALARMVEPAEPPGSEVAGLLASETVRLEETLRLYRLLPGGRAREAEPVLVADALADARALHAQHAGLAGVPCAVDGDPGALPPAIAPLEGLVHALTLLLGALALHAGAPGAGAGRRAVLTLEAGPGVVRLTGDGAPATGTHHAPLAPAAVAAALHRLLRGAGAVGVTECGGAVRYAVELRALDPGGSGQRRAGAGPAGGGGPDGSP